MKERIFRRVFTLLLTLLLTIVPALALSTQQAGELLTEYYIDSVPQRVLEQKTVEEMLSALGDPYTQHFSAETYAAFLGSMMDKKMGGIGVTGANTQDGFLIQSLLDSLPAQRAGLQPGDLITSINNAVIAGKNAEEIAALLQGEVGTEVAVVISRNGNSLAYTMVREEITIPATSSDLINGHIGYISCAAFGGETLGHFKDGIKTHDAKADRWLVDLRGNGGGDVDAAVQSAGLFAGGGSLAYLRDNEGRYGVCQNQGEALTMDPVIVLVDGGTASASEIFASIIRDRNAGLVVGSRTYGKGVAQILLDETSKPGYFTQGDALKITAYRFFSTNGTATDKIGVVPDLLVDDRYAADVAYLLSTANPSGDTTGLFRIDMKWRWYVDLKAALSEDGRGAFTALLEAIPSDTPMWIGTGGADGWKSVTAAEAAKQYGLTGYTSRSFSDLTLSPYAPDIDALAAYGIVAGGGDGTFRPSEVLTRAQFCALLAQAFHDHSTGTAPFSDVKADAWYAKAVNTLYRMGLVSGGGDGLFRPDDPMDHQQFLTIMGRLASRLCVNFFEADRAEHTAKLSDYWNWAEWSRNSVWLLDGSQTNLLGSGVSLLWTDVTKLDPAAVTTREEAAALLHSILVYTGILAA